MQGRWTAIETIARRLARHMGAVRMAATFLVVAFVMMVGLPMLSPVHASEIPDSPRDAVLSRIVAGEMLRQGEIEKASSVPELITAMDGPAGPEAGWQVAILTIGTPDEEVVEITDPEDVPRPADDAKDRSGSEDRTRRTYDEDAYVPAASGHLTRSGGVFNGPSGKETYYNLPMQGVVNIMRRMGYSEDEWPYWVREDGAKMLGDYIIVAANLNLRPRGTIVDTSLGQGIVCDTGGFAKTNQRQLDIAVDW